VAELTELAIKALKPRHRRRYEVRDAKTVGLVVRVGVDGAKSWAVRYRARDSQLARCYTIGPFRTGDSAEKGLTLSEARQEARSVLALVQQGKDPQGERSSARRRSEGRLSDLAERWLALGKTTKGRRAGEPWRAKTRAEFERLVRKVIVPALGHLAPEGVTKADIRAFYDREAERSQSSAKHALAVLRLLYQWASDEDHVDAVPTFPKRGTQSNKRSRVLTDVELRRVWSSLEAGLSEDENGGPGVMEAAFELMLLTAQRRGEVLSLCWRDVVEERDGAWWTIPAARHKSGRDHRVPLSAPAVALLKRLHAISGGREWAFPSPHANAKVPFIGNPQKAAERLWERSGVEGAVVHDFRRSAATYMARLGVARLVVGKVLGHTDVDVTGRYDVHAYDREKRQALAKWADELLRMVRSKAGAKRKAKVLPWLA